MPRDAIAGDVDVGESVGCRPYRGDELEAGHHRRRALLFGEYGSRFDRQGERILGSVVGDVAVGRLGGEPFLDVSRRDTGPFGEIPDTGRAEVGHGPPETETIPEVDQNGVVGRGLVSSDLAGELFEPAKVQGGCVNVRSHAVFPSSWHRDRRLQVQR